MSNWFTRRRRILGRIINKKALPAFTYRWDERTPQTIRATGFQPWNGAGTVTLVDHVKGSYSKGTKKGLGTKMDSQYVSTGAYGMLNPIDPTMAQKAPRCYLYKVDTAIALQTGMFYDVNDAFDRAGIDRPYAAQREWLKEGGIDQAAVIEYMTGMEFINQYSLVNGAPPEGQLQHWKNF